MSIIIESSLHQLLNKEQENRDKKSYAECLSICINILKLISNYNEDNIYDTISTIFHHKNQSNYVRIGIITYIISNNYLKITNTKNYSLKEKYYQLLIDSFKKDIINDRIQEKNDIIQYFEDSKLKNYDKLDNYILSLESIFINEKLSNTDRDIFNNSVKQKSISAIKFDGKNIIENNDLDEDLIVEESQQNHITQIGLVEDLNNNEFDLNNLNNI